jgi:hypothetical protein
MKRSLRGFLLVALAAGSIGVPTAAASCAENLGFDWCTSFYRSAQAGPAPSATVATPPGGFNWGDAGIGAAGSFALMLLGLSATITALRRRQRQEALPGGIA